MKTIKKFLYFAVAGTILVSCNKKYEEWNTNPNSPTSPNVEYLLSGSIFNGCQLYSGDVIGSFAEQMAFEYGLDKPSDRYEPGIVTNDMWQNLYLNIANVHQIVKLTSGNTAEVNRNSIARIWKAFLFSRLTDMYGDVPYFDAVRAEEGSSYLSPKYDAQKDIYYDLLKELQEAVNAINIDPSAVVTKYVSGDLMYGNNLDKWIKFGNSLRLRLALRLAGVDPTKAMAEIASVTADESKLMSSNHDNATFRFNNASSQRFLPVLLYQDGRNRVFPSKNLVDKLLSTNDPRLPVFAQTVKADSIYTSNGTFKAPLYRGMPNGLTKDERVADDYSTSKVSRLGTFFLNNNFITTILSYSEVCFMMSEVAYRGWGGSKSAEQYYNTGVEANMKSFTGVVEIDPKISKDSPVDVFNAIPDSSITNYLTDPTRGKFNSTLEQIVTQRWLSVYQEGGFEAWSIIRSTNLPKLQNADGTDITMEPFPIQKIPYPTSEQNLNERFPSNPVTKCWWDN